jgi:hypothetical protein
MQQVKHTTKRRIGTMIIAVRKPAGKFEDGVDRVV